MSYFFIIILVVLSNFDANLNQSISQWLKIFDNTNNYFESNSYLEPNKENYYDYAIELLKTENEQLCQNCTDAFNINDHAINIYLSKTKYNFSSIDSAFLIKSVEDLSPFSLFLLLYNREAFNYSDTIDFKSYIESLSESKIENTYTNIIQFKYLYDIDEYQKTLPFINKIEIQSIPDFFIRYRLANQIYFTYLTLGDIPKSNEILTEILIPLSYDLGDKEKFYNHKLDHAYSLIQLGRYDLSRQVLESILYKSEDIDIDLAVFNNLALINYKKGNNTMYLEYQLEAESLAISHNGYQELLNIYRNLHIFHKYNKNWASALLYLNKAKDLINEREFGDRELSALYRSIGDYYWEAENDLSKALLNINYSLEIIDPDNYYYTYLANLQVKFKFLESSELYDEAEVILKEIIELANQRTDQYNYLVASIDLAYMCLMTNDYERANELLNRIESYSISDLDFISIVKKSYLDLVLTTSNRHFDNNLSTIVDQIFERAKNSTLSQGGYWNLQKEYSEIFEFTADNLISNDRNTELITLYDRIKTINDASYFNNPLIASDNLSDDDIIKQNRLNVELADLRERLLAANQSSKASVQADIDRKSAELETLRTKVGNSSTNKTIPYWKLQSKIKKNQAVLYFIEINDHLYKTTITSDIVKTSKFQLTDVDRKLFNDVTQNLSVKKTDLNQLYKIQRKLELENIPEYVSEIIIIPDSYLLQIPIEILPLTKPEESYSYGSAKYFIEDYLVTYYSSIEELFMNSRLEGSDFSADFTGFGISNFDNITTTSLVPLPYAESEMDRIGNVLSHVDSKTINKTASATKSSFKSTVSDSRIIHLATHSEVSNDDPIYSTIYFKNDTDSSLSASDGTLYAYELYNLNIHSDLIFLNSCSSGSGNYLQGTGVMGINRALRYAGAKSLLLNLWPVNDNIAASFAETFYEELSKGLSKPEALRNAKLNQLANGSADPHYWGVYMLMGNPSPVFDDINSPSIAGIYSIAFAVLSLMIAIGFYQRRSFIQ